MTLTAAQPIPGLSHVKVRAQLRQRSDLLENINSDIHMHRVSADVALLRRAWQLAGGPRVMPPLSAAFLSGAVQKLTHLNEDDVTVAGYLIQGGEVRGRCWAGMWADDAECVNAASDLLESALSGGGPCVVVFCRLVCTAMDPDLGSDEEWEEYALAEAVDAWSGFALSGWER